MKLKLITYIFSLFIIANCGSTEEPIVEQEVLEPEKPKIKYRTYKRIIPMMKTDRMNLERTIDLQDARRYILKTFDSYKSEISSSSNSK